MLTEDELDRADLLADRISEGLASRSVGKRWRDHVAGAFQYISLRHHRAFAALLRGEHFASAMALVRPQFEAHLRGLWLLEAASEAQLDRFSETGWLPSTQAMVDQVKGHSLALRALKEHIWPAICDYTHTGQRTMLRSMKQGEIGFSYGRDELLAALGASNALAMLAADVVAFMTGDYELRKRFEQEALAELRRSLPGDG
jgi:hypothetical protein